MPTVTTDKYIYPPRPEGATPRGDYDIFQALGWKAQLKYNDTRILIKMLPTGKIELWNRHANRLRNYTPPIWLQEQLETIQDQLGPGLHILDGGLLHSKHTAIKNTIVIWDILVHNHQHLLGTTYNTRYTKLKETLATETPWTWTSNNLTYNLGISIDHDILMPQNLNEDEWENAWDMIDKINTNFTNVSNDIKPLIEGLVFKDLDGELEHGFKEKNNNTWQARSRVKTGRHVF